MVLRICLRGSRSLSRMCLIFVRAASVSLRVWSEGEEREARRGSRGGRASRASTRESERERREESEEEKEEEEEREEERAREREEWEEWRRRSSPQMMSSTSLSLIPSNLLTPPPLTTPPGVTTTLPSPGLSLPDVDRGPGVDPGVDPGEGSGPEEDRTVTVAGRGVNVSPLGPNVTGLTPFCPCPYTPCCP